MNSSVDRYISKHYIDTDPQALVDRLDSHGYISRSGI
jgi:hypothetical protein